LPTELAEAKVASLQGKFKAVRDVVEALETPVPAKTSIYSSVEDGFEEIENTRQLYESAFDQNPGAEATQELYEAYLGSIDAVARTLEMLELEIIYFDLYQNQRKVDGPERQDHAVSLSSELKAAFGIDITVFPVIWHEFAIEPIDENIPETGDLSQIYALILPRTQRDTGFYAPIVGHEIGHAVLDRHDELRTEFNTLIRKVQTRTRPQTDEDTDFGRLWRRWFKEFFCDTCGVLSFGPAYLSALVRYLYHPDPYRIETANDRELHPPPEMRFTLVVALAEELFPQLLEAVHDDRTSFERHLDALDSNRPRDYQTYAYDELLDFFKIDVPETVDNDMDGLVDDIIAGVSPADRPERSHRLAANQYWLERYPP
jgi:hypothetical protein